MSNIASIVTELAIARDDAPKFKHDCDKCEFLGTFEGHDLYVCLSKTRAMSSIIARRSSEGSDYMSSIPEHASRSSWSVMREAYARAQAKHPEL